jgi:hypothetical protein
MIKGKFAIRALGLLSLVGLLLLIWLSACASLEEKRDRFMAQGKAAFEKGDFIAARLHFKNALQLDPKLAEGHLWLGENGAPPAKPQKCLRVPVQGGGA